MTSELTVWVTPFTTLPSLREAINTVSAMAAQYDYHGNLLLPMAYGGLPQSMCNQTLPPDMVVGTVDDVYAIRQTVEDAYLGFGGWVVPLDPTNGPYHASLGEAAGYVALNFEGTVDFWDAGDNAGAIDDYYGGLWNGFVDQNTMNGNVGATMVPTVGEQLDWSEAGLLALAGGCNVLLLEVYGGPNTTYKYPNDWPGPSFRKVSADQLGVPLAPIIAAANLSTQFNQAVALGSGNVHVYSI